MSFHPSFAKAWLAQRRKGVAELVDVADAELGALTDDEALRRSEALLSMISGESVPAERRTTSGFLAQQRRFRGAVR